MKNLIIHLFFILFFAGGLALAGIATNAEITKKQMPVTQAGAQTTKIQSQVKVEFQSTDSEPVSPVDFLLKNWGVLSLSLLTFLEVVVRLTPTEKDNSIFRILNTIISALIPNLKKGGGTF